jgi:transcriptional regulator with XRE-family HTH domain
MKASKRKGLEAAGWTVGSAEEFLGLSPVEALLVELRLALGQALKKRRVRLHISQTTLAGLIKSSQSRVAKMEAADPEVSFELLLRGLFATGATRRDVAIVLGEPRQGKKLGTTPRGHVRGRAATAIAGSPLATGRRRARGRSRARGSISAAAS